MTMPTKLSKLLAKSDQDLFRQGACHIFAKVLNEVFSDLGYTIRCIDEIDTRPSGSIHSCQHVYCWDGTKKIDVCGVELESEYLEKRRQDNERDRFGFMKVVPRLPHEDELFEVASVESDGVKKSKSNLFVNAEFHPGGCRTGKKLDCE